jgi:hypothetical protein
MDALLSQKPFWNMFADPNAILVCKELSMDMLADVVVELRTERELYNTLQQQQQEETTDKTNETTTININEKKKDLVTVFDFAHILERTERRVEDDLLGAGPQSVQELRAIHGRLKTKYSAQLEVRLHKLAGTTPGAGTAAAAGTSPGASSPTASAASPGLSKEKVLHHATGLASGASAFAGNAGNWFAKMTSPGFSPVKTAQVSQSQPTPSFAPTMLTIPRTPVGASAETPTDFLSPTPTNAVTSTAAEPPEPPTPILSAIPSEATNMTDGDSDGDWSPTDIASATEGVSNFSIAGDDEDDDFL